MQGISKVKINVLTLPCTLFVNQRENLLSMCYLDRCPWTEAVWFGCGLSFWIKEHPIMAVDKWVEELLCGNLAKESSPEIVLGYMEGKEQLCFQWCSPNTRESHRPSKKSQC